MRIQIMNKYKKEICVFYAKIALKGSNALKVGSNKKYCVIKSRGIGNNMDNYPK